MEDCKCPFLLIIGAIHKNSRPEFLFFSFAFEIRDNKNGILLCPELNEKDGCWSDLNVNIPQERGVGKHGVIFGRKYTQTYLHFCIDENICLLFKEIFFFFKLVKISVKWNIKPKGKVTDLIQLFAGR